MLSVDFLLFWIRGEYPGQVFKEKAPISHIHLKEETVELFLKSTIEKLDKKISNFIKASKEVNENRELRKELYICLDNLKFWYEELLKKKEKKEGVFEWLSNGFEHAVKRLNEIVIDLLHIQTRIKALKDRLEEQTAIF